MKHPIISMVRAACKQCGVRFVVGRKPTTSLGVFDSSDRTLTIYYKSLRTRGRRRGKPRIRVNKPHDVLITAVHEMVHMCQWRRRDENWYVTDDSGNAIENVVYDALYGEKRAAFPILYKSALAAARLELEAEITSIRILELFGVPFPRSHTIRFAKAYAYSYLVFAHTGIMTDRRMWARWSRLVSNTLSFDITHGELQKMCDMARANPEMSFVVWDGDVCKKTVW